MPYTRMHTRDVRPLTKREIASQKAIAIAAANHDKEWRGEKPDTEAFMAAMAEVTKAYDEEVAEEAARKAAWHAKRSVVPVLREHHNADQRKEEDDRVKE